MKIDEFQMERMQSLYWHLVEYDLSESGVTPMTIRDLLGPNADAEAFLQTAPRVPALRGIARGARQHRRLVPGCGARERLAHDRRVGGQPPDALDAARARRPPGVHDPQLPAGLGPGQALRHGDRHVQAEAPRRALAARPGPARARGHQEDEGRDDLQPQQPDGSRPDRGRDERRDRRRRPRGRVDRVRRDLPRSRGRLGRRVAHVLGPLRQGHRHERLVEGVRDAGVAGRMDARAAGC